MAANFQLVQLDTLPAVPCPCGATRHAFAGGPAAAYAATLARAAGLDPRGPSTFARVAQADQSSADHPSAVTMR